METYTHNPRTLRTPLADWLANTGFDFFVTANFNQESAAKRSAVAAKRFAYSTTQGRLLAARDKLRAWHGHVDRKLLGANWSKAGVERRTLFVGFYEHAETNMHWHLLVKLRARDRAWLFEAAAAGLWSKLVESGTMDVRRLATLDDRARVAGYVTKGLQSDDAYERFLVSDEFVTADIQSKVEAKSDAVA
jgi:hypothetical protein